MQATAVCIKSMFLLYLLFFLVTNVLKMRFSVLWSRWLSLKGRVIVCHLKHLVFHSFIYLCLKWVSKNSVNNLWWRDGRGIKGKLTESVCVFGKDLSKWSTKCCKKQMFIYFYLYRQDRISLKDIDHHPLFESFYMNTHKKKYFIIIIHIITLTSTTNSLQYKKNMLFV